MTARRAHHVLVTGLLLIAAWLGGARAVAACSIDGVPSLAMNGRLVTINYGQATRTNFAYWAAFSLGAAPAGRQVRLAEDLAKVRRALSASAMTAPFVWTFGDGGSGRGVSVYHVFKRAGWYKVNVSYFQPTNRQWVIFDSAQVQVLAAPAHSAPGTAGAVPSTWLLGGAAAALVVCVIGLLYARYTRRVQVRSPRNGHRISGSRRAKPRSTG